MTDTTTSKGFWKKVGRVALAAGRPVIEAALTLWYVLQRPDVPVAVKGEIVAALAYFILPLDLIPDALPVVGYTDDLGLLLATVATVSAYVDDEVRTQVARTLGRWFGG